MVSDALLDGVLNESLNQTVNQSGFLAPQISYAKSALLPRMYDMLIAPSDHPDMLWTLGPMLVALVLMQLYFGRNKDEDLGWNTAFGNSVALIFISVSLLRGLYLMSGIGFYGFADSMLSFSDPKILVVIFLFGYGIFLSMLSFFHWIPARLAFFMMNGISINSTAYVGVVLVNSQNIPLDWTTIFAGVLIFLVAYLVFTVIRLIVPTSLESRINLLKRKKTIIGAKVRILERKAREARSDSRKAHFNEKARAQEALSKSVERQIEELQRQL